MAMQYGGWYDNPATGTNQRWWNGTWTNGAEPSSGGSSGGGGGSMPSFSFDYEGEAKKAYGELGAYYNRVLQWAEGDMNKALARLTQDYETGVRIKKEDTALAKSDIDSAQKESARLLGIARTEAKNNVIGNANARGLLQRSNFDTANATMPSDVIDADSKQTMNGFGIPTENFNKTQNPLLQSFAYGTEGRTNQSKRLDTGLTRYTDEATLSKTRGEEDAKSEMERFKFEQEQQRRVEAAQMANERGQRAFQQFQYSNLV